MQNHSFAQSRSERRRHQRFACEGKAEIRTADSVTVLWGQLTDLSISGCYIELPAPLVAGRTAQLTLTVFDLSFNVEGRVAVVHPMFGMGVAFTACAPQEAQKLRRILATLCSQAEERATASSSLPHYVSDAGLAVGAPLIVPYGSGGSVAGGGSPLLSSAVGVDSRVLSRVPPAPAPAYPTFRLTPQLACSALDQIVKHVGQNGALTRGDLVAILSEVQAAPK